MTDDRPIEMTCPPAVYRQRRAKLAARLARPLVICAGHAPARNYPANTHPFRAGSSYLYFGGPPLEHAAWLIEPASDGDAGCTLLRLLPGPDDIVWIGPTPDDPALAVLAGLQPSRLKHPDELPKLLGNRAAGVVPAPFPDTLAWIQKHKLQTATADELRVIINLRLTKDEHELAAMRRAAEIGIAAHRAALRAARPGAREADVAAAYAAVLVANQADHSFTPIITVHGEVLHSHGHPHVLAPGKMLLIDAGAEEPTGYATDITRTLPVNGRFNAVQRQMYDTVERAMQAAIAACVPGRRYRDVHFAAAREISRGLVDAEVLRGDPDDLTARAAHGLFFTHGVGHLIGLDVHDMEDFGDLAGYAPGRTRPTEFGSKFLRLDRDLEPGLTVTIEPGIYLVPGIWQACQLSKPFVDCLNRAKIDALLKDSFGGIRIEQTICVRDADGPEVLTGALPTNADEIAALVGAG